MRTGPIPPSPRGQFLLGHTLLYMRDPLAFLRTQVQPLGDVVQLRLGNTIVYVYLNPEHIDEILRGQSEKFMKDKLTRLLCPLVGNGLLTSEGSFWRKQRKLAQPGFQYARIVRYGEVMVEQSERLLASWKSGETRGIHDDMMQLTLGIVAKTLFNAEVGEQAATVGHSLEVVMDYFIKPTRWFRIREWLPTPDTLRHRAAIRRIDEIVYAIIKQRRAEDEDPGDLLSMLLNAQDEDGGRMTDKQLRDEVVTLFLAGHETTALTLTYIFDLLARNPEAHARLVGELDEVLGNRAPTAADMPMLRYTTWVVREALRLYPPAWAIAREALVDCEIGGYPVPKGTQIFLVQWLVHKDPRWFEEPEAFKPERWDNDLVKRLPRCAYFPFGDGPRVCIGNHFALMEAVLILATIASRYRLSLVDDKPIEVSPSITLRPKGAVRMVAQEREQVMGHV